MLKPLDLHFNINFRLLLGDITRPQITTKLRMMILELVSITNLYSSINTGSQIKEALEENGKSIRK